MPYGVRPYYSASVGSKARPASVRTRYLTFTGASTFAELRTASSFLTRALKAPVNFLFSIPVASEASSAVKAKKTLKRY